MAHDKDYEIIVNGEEHTVLTEVLTFDAILDIAFPGHPTGQDVIFTVTFDNAQSKPHQGMLTAGGNVTVKKKHTVFDVTQTGKS